MPSRSNRLEGRIRNRSAMPREDHLRGNSLRRNAAPVPEKSQARAAYEELDFSEEALDRDAFHTQKSIEKADKRQSYVSKIAGGVLIALCVYIVFLIYGIFMTDYKYDEAGVIVPQVLSVSDLAAKKKFDVVLVQYERCRTLYEKVLLLDYRFMQGVEDPASLSTEYLSLVEQDKTINVASLYTKINGRTFDPKYSQIKSMMLTWIKVDNQDASEISSLQGYIELMATALSQGNTDYLAAAANARALVKDEFSVLTQNIVGIGESLNGTDMTSIKEWNPEKFVESSINGG